MHSTGCAIHHVGDIDICDVGVTDVDHTDILGADRVGRTIDLARSQREPGHAHAAADREGCARAAPDKPHECWSIDRRDTEGPGNPAPRRSDAGPAAIVEWSKAPRLGAHPSPAPGIDPGPVAVSIWSPVRIHVRGHPDRSVALHILPVAVLVEIFIADHVGRHVAGRGGALFARFAGRAKAVEVVGRWDIIGCRIRQVVPGEAVRRTGADRIRPAFADDVGLTFAHRRDRHRPVGAGRDAVPARLCDREGEVRRVNFDHVLRGETPHTHAKRPLGQLQLCRLVIEIGERDTGLAVEPERDAADVQFGTGTRVGPETVTGDQGTVGLGLDPVLGSCRIETDGPVNVTQARHAPGWIGHGRHSGGGHNHAQGQAQRTNYSSGWIHVAPL